MIFIREFEFGCKWFYKQIINIKLFSINTRVYTYFHTRCVGRSNGILKILFFLHSMLFIGSWLLSCTYECYLFKGESWCVCVWFRYIFYVNCLRYLLWIAIVSEYHAGRFTGGCKESNIKATLLKWSVKFVENRGTRSFPKRVYHSMSYISVFSTLAALHSLLPSVFHRKHTA